MVLVLTKLNGSYYEFIDKFCILSMRIVRGHVVPRFPQIAIDKLHVIGIGDWYFWKERTIILRYGYFEIPFFLPKFVIG